MRFKSFFKFLTFIIALVLIYFSYKQIIILKDEYVKKIGLKKEFSEKIENSYKERSENFYKMN